MNRRMRVNPRIIISALALVIAAGVFAFRGADAPTGDSAETKSTIVVQDVERAAPTPREVRVPILAYHNIRPTPDRPLSAADRQYEVTPEQFTEQMGYLAANGYAAIGFDDLAAAVRGEKDIPERSVLITLDDGRAAQYDYALPVLAAHGFTATFFVFSNAVDRPGYFTSDQIRALRDAGMTIGSHTRYHQYLTRMTDDAELQDELTKSKAALEGILGTSVTVLAYPFGLVDDRVAAAAREAGYLMARGLAHESMHGVEDLMTLGSYITTGNLSAFKAILASP